MVRLDLERHILWKVKHEFRLIGVDGQFGVTFRTIEHLIDTANEKTSQNYHFEVIDGFIM